MVWVTSESPNLNVTFEILLTFYVIIALELNWEFTSCLITMSPPLPKSCHTYPTMMKLGTLIPYLKEIQKIYKSRDTPFEFCWHQHFLQEISKFCYIKKYRYRFYFDTLFLILLTFFESWKTFLINMITILMMSAKMATLGLLKIKVFWNKGYGVIISVYYVINKNLSLDSNYIVDVVMWPKFGNCSTSMREVMITSIYKDLTRKITFLGR